MDKRYYVVFYLIILVGLIYATYHEQKISTHTKKGNTQSTATISN